MNLKPGVEACAQNSGTSGSETRSRQTRICWRSSGCVLLLLGNKQEKKRAHQRREQNDRKNVVLHKTVLSSH